MSSRLCYHLLCLAMFIPAMWCVHYLAVAAVDAYSAWIAIPIIAALYGIGRWMDA